MCSSDLALQVNRFVPAVFIARAQYLAVLRTIAYACGGTIETRPVFVEMDGRVTADAAADFAVGKSHPVGTVAAALGYVAVYQHAVVFEIEFLPDTGAQAFRARGFVEIAGLQGDAEAVGRVDAVVAGIELFTEKLFVVEAVFYSDRKSVV